MNRSLIFVPAKEKMLSKIASINSDKYIIDLEDSIAINEKDEALNIVEFFLKSFEDTSKIIVRLNKERYSHELIVLSQFNIDFMLPKFEAISEYSEISIIAINISFMLLLKPQLV